ncbi:MAG TPA: I78 family peptidase inhibitor [Paracoccaceae bacterium]
MYHRLIVAGLALALAACTPEAEAPGPGLPPADDACGAAALQGLVGQPAAVLEAMTFGPATRVLRPGMAVTMDYSAERLNIEVDAAETIIRVSCG